MDEFIRRLKRYTDVPELTREGKYIEMINKRLSTLTLKRKIRSDAILMNSFVIGSDGEFFKDMRAWEQRAFFEDCVRFFMDKYGY